MVYIKVLIWMIFAIVFSSCIIERPPTEEIPYTIINETSSKGFYLYEDTLNGLKINLSVGYFTDTVKTYSNIMLEVENFGYNIFSFDSSSLTLQSDYLKTKLILIDPNKISINHGEEDVINYLFRSEPIKQYPILNKEDQLILVKLDV